MSKIEWTDETWNPIVGCTKVSPGCKNCYAERMAKRLAAMGVAHYAGTVNQHGHWTGQMNWAGDEVLRKPLRWKKSRMVFVNSMSDLFHPGVPDEWILRVWDVMADARHHTFQVLTKRPARMAAFLTAHRPVAVPNVWIGTSVENQAAADERIPELMAAPAAVRFLSCEPLLGPVTLAGQVDWVIVGGESGPGARPMHPDWVRKLRDHCEAAGVPFFFKQWGSQASGQYFLKRVQAGATWQESSKGGRMLDGCQWDGMPVKYAA